MAQYVLANRRADRYSYEQKSASRASVTTTLGLLQGRGRIVSDVDRGDDLSRRVVVLEADDAQVLNVRARMPADAILEPLVRRALHTRTPLIMREAVPVAADGADHAAAATYRVSITAGGNALVGIDVLFYLQDGSGQLKITQRQTDNGGWATVGLRAGMTVAMVEPVPYAGFWIVLVEAPPSGTNIDCPPIPRSGPAGWWHTALGVDPTRGGLGQGIRVGVIDTGCGPHANLNHVNLAGVCVNNQVLPGPGARDVAEHGTHTSGLIGARPTGRGEYAGLAPDCDLFHVRAFASEDQGPSQADLVNAIDLLSRDNRCDLINMSLGGGPPSQIEEDAIRDAAQRGTLCICSAGNESSAIDYPAAYPECAAVSAIGLLGWAPPGSFSAGNRPDDPALIGQNGLFLATFSCYGAGLACAGPGVGIISTVPDHDGGTRLYMEMDGTSMASPAACGALASILAADADYGTLARDISRYTAARTLLGKHCASIGLAMNYQGQGVPKL